MNIRTGEWRQGLKHRISRTGGRRHITRHGEKKMRELAEQRAWTRQALMLKTRWSLSDCRKRKARRCTLTKLGDFSIVGTAPGMAMHLQDWHTSVTCLTGRLQSTSLASLTYKSYSYSYSYSLSYFLLPAACSEDYSKTSTDPFSTRMVGWMPEVMSLGKAVTSVTPSVRSSEKEMSKKVSVLKEMIYLLFILFMPNVVPNNEKTIFWATHVLIRLFNFSKQSLALKAKCHGLLIYLIFVICDC